MVHCWLSQIVVLPLLTKIMVALLSGNSELGSFGFMYNCLPPSPAVAVFATQFDAGKDTVSAGIVYALLFSAPVILGVAVLDAEDIGNIRLQMMNDGIFFGKFAVVSLVMAAAFMLEVACRFKMPALLRSLLPVLLFQLMTTSTSMTSSAFGPMCKVTAHNLTGVHKVARHPTWEAYYNLEPTSSARYCLYEIGICGARMWSAALAVQMLFINHGTQCCWLGWY